MLGEIAVLIESAEENYSNSSMRKRTLFRRMKVECLGSNTTKSLTAQTQG